MFLVPKKVLGEVRRTVGPFSGQEALSLSGKTRCLGNNYVFLSLHIKCSGYAMLE